MNGTLPLCVLEKLFSDLKAGGAKGVTIEGGGEPTVHPEFDTVVKRADSAGLALGLITNGYILPLNSMSRFEWIRISLDAADRGQYERLKGVDGFHRVINNLATLTASRQVGTVGVGYVVTNQNNDPLLLEQLVLFLKKTGVSYIQFRPVVDHPELSASDSLTFLKKYETEDFTVNLKAMTDNKPSGNSGLPCLAHSLSAVIAADGSVFLCGRLNHHASWEPLGNLKNRSFKEIWTGEKRKEQVRLVSRAEFCRDRCPQCRMTKYNRLLSEMDRIKTRNFI